MQAINWKITSICCCFVIASCSSSDNSTQIAQNGNTNLDNPLVATDEPFDGLRVIGDKEKFSTSIKAALVNSLSSGAGGIAVTVDAADTPQPVAAPEALPSAPVSAEADSAASADTALNVTETNVQEIGVDESDRVKSDGRYLYVLNSIYGDVQVSEPEVLPDGFRTSVVYEPNGVAEIKVLSLDNEAADAQLLTSITIETENQRADGLYLYQTDAEQSLIVTSSSMGSYWGYWGAPLEFHGEKSTVHKFDIADPSIAQISDSLNLDGQIVASRRIGDYLYVATRFFPWPDDVDLYSNDPQALEQTINDTPVEALLPVATRRSDGAVQPMADAANCFVASKSSNDYYSPDIVTLAVIDLRSLEVSGSVCYLGASETLYASTNAIYLATTDWNYEVTPVGLPPVAIAEPEPATEPAAVPPTDVDVDPEDTVVGEQPVPTQEPFVQTSIHQFDIVGGGLNYVGSGKINGNLGWDYAKKPYRMGENDGHLRVVSYDEFQDGSRSPVTLSILKPAGDGRLDVIAQLPNENRPEHIGKPGEQLYASRFLGDKAYLVTFRQTDPLYVVDLSNPEDPYIAGELEIPGFSDYLRPIGENHLLGIGRGAIAANNGEGDRGAFAQGVKISLFDVADPSSPTEVQSIEIGKRGSQSNALYDPHAITVQLGAEGEPTRLAIGIDINDIPTPYSGEPSGWYDWRETGLFGFEISTDVNAGISEHGKMIVESVSEQQNYGPFRGEDRSVIVNDAVFYIHGEQVFGANWNSMDNYNGPR